MIIKVLPGEQIFEACQPSTIRAGLLKTGERSTMPLVTPGDPSRSYLLRKLDGAFCDPKPVQQLPELWIGGGGERVTLRIAARLADKTNWQVGLDEFVHKSEVLREHCEREGRAFDTIVRTHGPDCCLFDSERDLDAWLESPTGGHPRKLVAKEEYTRDNFVGTPEQVAEKVQAFVDAGCREFVLWFRDAPSSESLERFAAEVIPRIRD